MHRLGGALTQSSPAPRDLNLRYAHPFTQDMVNQVSGHPAACSLVGSLKPGCSEQVHEFFFRNYLRHWSQPVFSDVLNTIPQVWAGMECEVAESSPTCDLPTLGSNRRHVLLLGAGHGLG